ncbi:MAG: hypothetical protein HRT89_03100 [Lentisphaeria bacterium]|nr:hypothetical protein [Lentisphaeria bacterium]NQZ67037.1 hypothetical protein [Lentisphaeria bacterium]
MEILGHLLAIFGIVVIVVCSFWMLLLAFQESILWGLGYMFVPFVSMIFIISFWSETKRPFLIGLCGFLFIFGGVVINEVGGGSS